MTFRFALPSLGNAVGFATAHPSGRVSLSFMSGPGLSIVSTLTFDREEARAVGEALVKASGIEADSAIEGAPI